MFCWHQQNNHISHIGKMVAPQLFGFPEQFTDSKLSHLSDFSLFVVKVSHKEKKRQETIKMDVKTVFEFERYYSKKLITSEIKKK